MPIDSHGVGQISDADILSSAIKDHQADPDSKDDLIPDYIKDTPGLNIDPKKVAAGEPIDLGDDDGDKDKNDDDKNKGASDPPDVADDDLYIPEPPKDTPPAKPAPAPAPKDEPKKPATPSTAADDDEVNSFLKKLKDDEFEQDTIDAIKQAIELGGKQALKQIEKQQTEKEAAATAAKETADAEFDQRRMHMFTTIGEFQKENRIPRVPKAIQEKFAKGENLTEDEGKHPGIQRQFKVLEFMTQHNKATQAAGRSNFIPDFAMALDLLEAKELRDEAAKKDKQATDRSKKKSSVLKGGGGGGGASDKNNSGGYVRGQSLDEVAQSIMDDFQHSN